MVLADEELAKFSVHLTRVLELPQGLDFGFERLLEAVTDPRGPIETLVDAVLFWESLVGARSETTFRVCGSIARLLQPGDFAAAQELYRELSAIYGRQSTARPWGVGRRLHRNRQGG